MSVRVGPWGGEDGSQWQYEIKANERITGYLICANSECVYALHLNVEPKNQVLKLFGDVGGDRAPGRCDTFNFEDDEHITGFSGTYATNEAGNTYVTSLSFITNKQTYGPTGTPRGTSFLLPVTRGKFVGYFGWFSAGLSSLGAILKATL
ncbi:lectin 3 [Artemisia annua]|uniref:Lectin 3 n=1 Tax=Artemisia annua TaxID=35608 RepID=A0A2U1L7A9_ARTAN|nr:lectin 3 [Artemisia annua]